LDARDRRKEGRPEQSSSSQASAATAAPPRKLRRIAKVGGRAPRSREWYPGEFDKWEIEHEKRELERIKMRGGDAMDVDPFKSDPRDEHVSSVKETEGEQRTPELGGSFATAL